MLNKSEAYCFKNATVNEYIVVFNKIIFDNDLAEDQDEDPPKHAGPP